MREITLDTETTGLDPNSGHRIIEIGCIELFNRIPTGNVFHTYINPNRQVSQETIRITGLTDTFLADKPFFKTVVRQFLDFIKGAKLIIHNAKFDMKFLNFQLNELSISPIEESMVICTLIMAKKKYPGSPASLDALCKRFNIDRSSRSHHGALIDALLLKEVYIALLGGIQTKIYDDTEMNDHGQNMEIKHNNAKYEILSPPPTLQEIEMHNQAIQKIRNALWHKQKSVII